MRKNAKNLIYDTLHRGFVLTSVAVTVGASIMVGIQTYRYFAIVKPLRKQLQLEQEQQLLREGMDTPDQDSQLRM